MTLELIRKAPASVLAKACQMSRPDPLSHGRSKHQRTAVQMAEDVKDFVTQEAGQIQLP